MCNQISEKNIKWVGEQQVLTSNDYCIGTKIPNLCHINKTTRALEFPLSKICYKLSPK